MTWSPSTIRLTVDLVDVDRFCLTVRDHTDGRKHTIAFGDDIQIGASDEGSGYTLIMPRTLAILHGVANA
ncbi:hypothetical protein LQG66_03910 [Bradyrhizobium ontarionense]|uniref:Uncharacterized protein n=1 Tax=Bradyrhizobium ontarionense TaxID=2898149 RepID=A0ABY3REP4_9BRAD|nr:hypothetical protein [Bradyrhizobium sp. A19]UFZ05472.1 hypothetical protein LQG66_03910 [Bradyrhizobium sp. A19]